MVCQFQAGHPPRHLDIGEQGVDRIGLSRQYPERFLGLHRLDDGKPGIGQSVNGRHAYQDVVFGDDDDNGRTRTFACAAHHAEMRDRSGGCCSVQCDAGHVKLARMSGQAGLLEAWPILGSNLLPTLPQAACYASVGIRSVKRVVSLSESTSMVPPWALAISAQI